MFNMELTPACILCIGVSFMFGFDLCPALSFLILSIISK